MDICCPGLHHPCRLLGITVPHSAFRERFPSLWMLIVMTSPDNRVSSSWISRWVTLGENGWSWVTPVVAPDERLSMNSYILSFLNPNPSVFPSFYVLLHILSKKIWEAGDGIGLVHQLQSTAMRESLHAVLFVQCFPSLHFCTWRIWKRAKTTHATSGNYILLLNPSV